MPLARITWQGLSSIAVLVVCLWGCFVAETLTVRRAQAETHRALKSIHKIKVERHISPASTPAPQPRTLRPAIG